MICNISPIPKDYCEIIEPKMDDKRPLEKFFEEDLEYLSPGQNLDGKGAKGCGNGAGIERDSDMVMEHLDAIRIEGTVKD